MNLFKEAWVTTQRIDGREREVIFILLEIARFCVHPDLRNYRVKSSYHICGFGSEGFNPSNVVYKVDPKCIKEKTLFFNIKIEHFLTKEQLKEYLIKLIKNED